MAMTYARNNRRNRRRGSAYGSDYGYGRNYLRLIERAIVLIILIVLIGKFGIPYLYKNTAGGAYNSLTVSDIRSLTSQIKIYMTTATDGQQPVAFKRASSSRGRKFYLKGYNPTTGRYETSDTEVVLSADVSICFTPLDVEATNEVDADSGIQPYRIYGSNAWNLDVYYVYDSRNGKIVKQNNPNQQPVATNDREGMSTAMDPATSISFCDLKIASDTAATTGGTGSGEVLNNNEHNHVKEDGTTLFDDMGI